MHWDGLRLSVTLLTAIPVTGSRENAAPADTGPSQAAASPGGGWQPGAPPAGDWQPGVAPEGGWQPGTAPEPTGPAGTLPVEVVPADDVLADAYWDDAEQGGAHWDDAGLAGVMRWDDAGPGIMRRGGARPGGTGQHRAGETARRQADGNGNVAGRAMAWAPAVGLGLGVIAAAVLFIAGRLLGTGPFVAAVLAIGSLAVLTRGLHLDGLADLADGLGSRKPRDQALAIMRRPDIGPFGVVTLVLTLLVQVAALSRAEADGRGIAALIAAAVTGRLVLAWACRRGVPPARRDGLGALVAGTLRPAAPVALTVAVLAAAVAAGVMIVMAGASPAAPWILPVAVAAGVAASLALLGHAVRRLGGITGDVLGALVETATAVCLVVMAMG